MGKMDKFDYFLLFFGCLTGGVVGQLAVQYVLSVLGGNQ